MHSHSHEKKDVDAGSIQIEREQKKTGPIPPALSAIALLGGDGLVVVGVRSNVLIAAISMRKHERFGAIPADFDVVAKNSGHETFRARATGESADGYAPTLLVQKKGSPF